jgi:hypothetical protein
MAAGVVAPTETGPGPALQTYRYLRLTLALPAVFLIVATLLEAWNQAAFRQSISDSYQGPVRDVFVGALMASGVCMIAYKGRSKLEDYALNFGGFNTFFVALVPNNFTQVLRDAPTGSLGATGTVTREQMLTNLRLVLAAFLLVAVVFVVLDARLMQWSAIRWQNQQPVSNVLVVVSWVAEVVFIVVVGGVLMGWETLFGASIFGIVHFAAAGLLIANLSFAVASHAFPDKLRTAADDAPEPHSTQVFYRVVVALMWLGLLVGGFAIAKNVSYSVLATEYYEIVMFLLFWAVATRHGWNPTV